MKVKEKKNGEVKMTLSLYEFTLLKEVLGNLTPNMMKELGLDDEQRQDALYLYRDMAMFFDETNPFNKE